MNGHPAIAHFYAGHLKPALQMLLGFVDAAYAPPILLFLIFAALISLWAALRLAKPCRQRKKGERIGFKVAAFAAFGVLFFVAFQVASIFALAWGWYFYRPRPAPGERQLFQGVVLKTIVQREPFPLVAHVVKIDLDAPGIRLLSTPPDRSGGREFRAMLTRDFLTSVGAQIAINAGYFQPYHSKGPWDYYPHKSDPVETLGFAASDGRRTSIRRPGYRTLVFSKDNQARIEDRATTGWNAVSGLPLSLEPGSRGGFSNSVQREPRSAVALGPTSRTLLIVAIDGRQPNYSDGATFDDVAAIIRAEGGTEAISLDGGGSTSLAEDDGRGGVRMLNVPIDSRIPGLERPVANHLAVFARPLKH